MTPEPGTILKVSTDSRCATHGNHPPGSQCNEGCDIFYVRITEEVITWPMVERIDKALKGRQ